MRESTWIGGMARPRVPASAPPGTLPRDQVAQQRLDGLDLVGRMAGQHLRLMRTRRRQQVGDHGFAARRQGQTHHAPVAGVGMAADQAVALHPVEDLGHGRLLQQAGDEYPILQITSGGHALLKDAAAAGDLTLARQKRPDRRLPKRARVETEGWEGVDRELFEELRVLRMEIARRRRVPPYVIFHDTTLREIARSKPRTIDELRHVYGVGDRKADDLGELVLGLVKNLKFKV